MIDKTILKRTSVRSYNGNPISEDDRNKILDYLQDASNLIGPFGNIIRFQYKDLVNEETGEKVNLGTYGVIKGHKALVAGLTKNTKEGLIDLGFVIEKFVLFLTKNNVGSCWMAGTYDKKQLKMIFNKKDYEIIPVVLPIGYAKDKIRVTDFLVRKIAGSNYRKPSDELFFFENFNKEYRKEYYKDEFQMVRIAPSASNKQPWRFVVAKNNDVHIFIERTKGYASSLKFDVQMIDIGIAMAHFELTCELNGKKVTWIDKDPNINMDNSIEYVITHKDTTDEA